MHMSELIFCDTARGLMVWVSAAKLFLVVNINRYLYALYIDYVRTWSIFSHFYKWDNLSAYLRFRQVKPF